VSGDDRTSSRWRAYLALLVAINGTAWSAILVRWAGVPGTASGFYRTLIAALVLVPWWLIHRGRLRPERRGVVLALVGGAFFALDLAFYNTAVLRTRAATAALLGNLTPVFVGLLTWILFRRRPGGTFWAGLLLGLGGCAAIVGADALRPHTPGSLGGDVLALAAAVFFAGYLMTTEHVRAVMDTLTFNTIAIVGSTLTLLIVCLVLRDPLKGYGTHTWFALLALGLVSQLGAYLALVYALGHLPATITAVGLLAQVPLTAVLAMVFLGEPLSWIQIAGGVGVLAGIYVVGSERSGYS
jgi:drug/metabolite transporter (DMT)-like permease